ncbi:hypothetical protein F0562_036215 [Nyssa sinensis]|uniref:Uncharacterized protein n=1 Tax=Nyssa sinensis TaxID=561372 RepID=A0A5J5AE57_9ASTE|nr:hypothetical protein F0562_036215 [Nyssa sinensis]
MASLNDGIENLISARKSLVISLEKSKVIGLALDRAGPILDEINQRSSSLEAAVRTILLKVFDAIHGLEKSLLDLQLDLPWYLSMLKRLEEALIFLGDDCGMAIQWLDDMVDLSWRSPTVK